MAIEAAGKWRSKQQVGHDDSVELVVLSAVEAELFAARLRGAEIDAAVFDSPPSGPYPGVQWSQGSRVVVRDSERAAAAVLLDDDASA